MVNQVRGACKREDVLAATPPLAAMRFILSRAVSRGHGRCLGLWDVSVAFFHAATEEEVFVRPPKNMRKDKTTRTLLKAMHGTQVASSRWQRLVRETLCDGHWKVLTSVRCVAYNETEDSLVMFHGDWMKCWEHSRSSACRAWVQQLVVRVCFSAQDDTMERIWILAPTRSKTRGCIDCDFAAGRRKTCCKAIHT